MLLHTAFMAITVAHWDALQQEFKRQHYFDRKVRHLVALAMNSAIKDRPSDAVAYLGDFFEARTRFY